MEKVRELTIDGAGPYRVSNVRGILDLGKFQGEQAHAVRDYFDQDETFGDESEGYAPHWRSGNRYYFETSAGFVHEIDAESFEQERAYYENACALESEREEALGDARNALEEAEAEDRGTCAQCEALMINGTRCHETGCPVPANIERLRARVEAIEEG